MWIKKKKKKLNVLKFDDIELDYVEWAFQFTLDHTAEDSMDYHELLNLLDYVCEVKRNGSVKK